MAGRPKGKTLARAPKRCAYQNGVEICTKWATGSSPFCAQHAVAPNAEQAAEINALGMEAAAALREELELPPVEKVVMKEQVEEREPRFEVESPASGRPEQPAMPEAAVRDPIGYAMKLALEQVAVAYAEDHEARTNSRNPLMRMSAIDRARIKLAGFIPGGGDAAAMLGKNGETLVKKGWIGRWVRDKDEDGRPNTRRYREFMAMGCEDVLDTDGRALVGRLGRAVQMPPEVYAARVLEKSQPGAFESNPYVQGAIEMAEATNRAMGRKIVDVRPTADHRGYRGME